MLPGNQPPRLQVLWGPQQFLLLLLFVLFLLLGASRFTEEPVAGEVLNWADRWTLPLLCGAMAVLVLVPLCRSLVLAARRGLRVAGRGWLAWDRILDVQVEDVDERIFPIEAPVLRLDMPITRRGPGEREELTGLAGYRFRKRNRRVWRDANRIRRWAQLPPLPDAQRTTSRPLAQEIPRRAKGVSDAEREMVEELATYARSLMQQGEGVDVEEHQVADLPTFLLHPGNNRPGLGVIGEQWIVIESDSGLRWELDYTPEGISTAKRLIDHALAGTLTRRSDGSTSLASAVRRWLGPPGRRTHE